MSPGHGHGIGHGLYLPQGGSGASGPIDPEDYNPDFWLRPDALPASGNLETLVNYGTTGGDFDSYANAERWESVAGPNGYQSFGPTGNLVAVTQNPVATPGPYGVYLAVFHKDILTVASNNGQALMGNFNSYFLGWSNLMRYEMSGRGSIASPDLSARLGGWGNVIATLCTWFPFLNRHNGTGLSSIRTIRWSDEAYDDFDWDTGGGDYTAQGLGIGVAHSQRDPQNPFTEQMGWYSTHLNEDAGEYLYAPPSHWPNNNAINRIMNEYLVGKYAAIGNFTGGLWTWTDALPDLVPSDYGSVLVHIESTAACRDAFGGDPTLFILPITEKSEANWGDSDWDYMFSAHPGLAAPIRSPHRTLNGYPVMHIQNLDTWGHYNANGTHTHSGPFTCFWVSRKAAGVGGDFQFPWAASDQSQWVGIDNNIFRIDTSTGQTSIGTTNVADDAWHIMCIRRDSSDNLYGYLDGSDDTNGTPNRGGTLAMRKAFVASGDNFDPVNVEGMSWACSTFYDEDIGIDNINDYGNQLSGAYDLGQSWEIGGA